MKPWRTRLFLVAGVSALAAAVPALSQDSPQSLLPPGFGDPEPAPKTRPEPERPPEPETPAPTPGNVQVTGEAPPPAPMGAPRITDSAEQDLEQLRPVRPTYTQDVPAGLARPLDIVGVLDAANWGFGPGAFGPRGAYLASLMRQLDAPVPSRWVSMLLRRALMSRVAAPAGIDPVDWVATRAALLLRMGEADAARALVQSVDVVNHTPAMIQAALDTALATSDPAALCPLIEPGRRLGDQPVWRMADAICAALAGEAARAGAAIDEARRRGGVAGADLLLAEKVIGAGTDSRRAVSVEWDEVDRLTPWRFGLAGATGAEMPDRLIGRAEPRMRAWYARAPMVPVEQRLAAAETAAALGVFSSSALVEMYSLVFEAADPAEAGETPAGRLRAAFADRDPGRRLAALRDLWGGEGVPGRYARYILTAGAASRIPPAEERAEQAATLIAAMLSAGLDREAARWSGVAAAGEADPLAWALLAVGAPEGAVPVTAGEVERFRGSDESRGDRRTRALIAALAGLGRLPAEEASSLAAGLGIPLGREDRWTRALDEAVRARLPGTVALLAAVGMQAPDWSRVPAASLYRIVRALRAAGLEFEARMVAAEALMRL